MPLATLSIDMVARLAELQAGMDKAATLGERTAGRIQAAFGKLQAIGSVVGAGLAGALSVAGIAQFVRATADGVDALNDLKDATGDSIENLSALEDLAARTGTSLETVGGGLLKLQKDLLASVPDSDTAAAIRGIGLSVQELKKLAPSEALRQVAVALNGLEEGPKRARYILQLFGKSTQEIAPFLKDLAEAGQLNAKVTADQAQAAEDFNKQLYALSKNSVDTARALVGELLPSITSVLRKFNERGALGAGGDAVREAKSGIAQVVDAYRLLALAAERTRLQGVIDLGPEKTDIRNIEQAKARLAEIDVEGRKLAGTFETARAAYLGIGTSMAGAGRGFVNPPSVKLDAPDLDPQAGKVAKAYEALMRSIRQRGVLAQAELDNNDKLDAADVFRLSMLEKLTDGEYQFGAAMESAARKEIERIAVIISQVDARKRLRDVQEASFLAEVAAADAAEAAAQASVQETAAIREQIETLGMSAQALELRKIKREEDRLAVLDSEIATKRSTGASVAEVLAMQAQADQLRLQIDLRRGLAEETQRRLQDQGEGMKRALDSFVRQAKEAGTAMEQAFGQGLSTLEDDLTRSLEAGKLNVRSFTDFVRREVLRLEIVRPALQRLFGGGGTGGPLGSLFDLVSSGLKSNFAGFFADGGTLGAGQWGIAGEYGPEPVVGPATVIPASRGGDTFNFYVNGDVSRDTIARLQASVMAAMERVERGRRLGLAN